MATKNDDPHSVILKVSKAISTTLNELHLAMEAFSDAVAVREDEHAQDLLLPGFKRLAAAMKTTVKPS